MDDIEEFVDKLEKAMHPEGRCLTCGGGKPYWKHLHDHPFKGISEMWEDNIFAPEPATHEIDYDHEAALMSQHFKALARWDKGVAGILTNEQIEMLSKNSWLRTQSFRWMDWYERED